MASKYLKQYQIPNRFPEILKDFTREVLRAQPDDINSFAAAYFADLQNGGDGRSVKYERRERTEETQSTLSLSASDIGHLIQDLFAEADLDGSGYLDRKEFRALFERLSGKFGFAEEDIWLLLSEADENNDGRIQYHEFIPLATQIIQSIIAKLSNQQAKQQRKINAEQEAERMLFHGLPREELEQVMRSLFEEADKDKSGQLSREEFRNCIKSAELGLTRKEINVLMSEVDSDHNGLISYEEFIPLCIDILVRLMANNILSQVQGDELSDYLRDFFASADSEGTGFLYPDQIRQLLRAADLGLTRLQIYAMLSEAELEESGCIAYDKFAVNCSSMIQQMMDFEGMQQKISVIQQVASSGETLNGLTKQVIEDELYKHLSAADVDGSSLLDLNALTSALTSACESLGFSSQQQKLLIQIADMESGMYVWQTVVDNAFAALKYVEREQALRN